MAAPGGVQAMRALQVGGLAFLATYVLAFLGVLPAPVHQPLAGTWSMDRVPGAFNMGWYGCVIDALAAGILAAALAWPLSARDGGGAVRDRAATRLLAALLSGFAALSAMIVLEMGREWIWR